MADDNRHWLNPKEIMKHGWEILEFLSVASHGVQIAANQLGFKLPSFDVDKEKGRVSTMTPSSFEGGDDSLVDERHFEKLIRTSLKTYEARERVCGWYITEFPFESTTFRTRMRALKAAAEFRSFVTGMDSPQQKVGTETTTRSTKEDGKEVEKFVRVIDIYGNPVDDAPGFFRDLDARIQRAYLRITGNERVADFRTWPDDVVVKVFAEVSAENRSRAMPHMPTANEPTLLSTATDIAKKARDYAGKAALVGEVHARAISARAARVARAKEYLALRKKRTREQKQTGKWWTRLFERFIRSM